MEASHLSPRLSAERHHYVIKKAQPPSRETLYNQGHTGPWRLVVWSRRHWPGINITLDYLFTLSSNTKHMKQGCKTSSSALFCIFRYASFASLLNREKISLIRFVEPHLRSPIETHIAHPLGPFLHSHDE